LVCHKFFFANPNLPFPPYSITKDHDWFDFRGLERDHMKKYLISLGILLLMALAKSPVLAHEECDDGAQPQLASSESHQTVALPSQPESKVTIKLFQYQPGRIQATVGTTVTWLNEDEIFHTVTASEPDKRDGGFDAALDGKGKSFSFTFSQPGVYSYYCDRHEHMRGEIEVR
jgi:plastocyanin